MTPKNDFTALHTDDRKRMLFRTPLETFLHLKPTVEERRVQPGGLEIAAQLYIDTEVTADAVEGEATSL